MSDTVNFAELGGQHIELLPTRTVLSMVWHQAPVGNASGNGIGDGAVSTAMTILGLPGGSQGASGGNADGDNGATS